MAALKHYFVVNPVSGKNNKIDIVNELIIPACEKLGVDYEIYTTKAAGDGIRFVDETATALGDAPCRFYAVGGDGTLYEVVNGAFGHKNAQVAVVPKGSGNDWIRLFGDKDLFLDIEGQIEGTPYTIDCLKAGDEIAINQASMGFDAETCALQVKAKSIPGAAGHATYFLAGLYCMFTRVWHDFDVTVDGKRMTGPFIQVVGANSRWYGSGIMVAP
ncbi:MAG: diacylglycerol kinase family protein, partial [Acutalibacteraceae bacterium]|nr:diacylglycerol kinase family protein [Acutalibacteraceae bacterium]